MYFLNFDCTKSSAHKFQCFPNREVAMRFADLERKLGEIDRARAIYAHTSQICDPRVSQLVFSVFWCLFNGAYSI